MVYGVPLGSKVYCQCDTLIILRGTLIILRATLDIDIGIEILFFVEYCTTWNISPVGLLFRQTRVN